MLFDIGWYASGFVAAAGVSKYWSWTIQYSVYGKQRPFDWFCWTRGELCVLLVCGLGGLITAALALLVSVIATIALLVSANSGWLSKPICFHKKGDK